MKPIVEFRGVRKRFGAHLALNGVDVAIPARRTTAVVGESGSGKTTLLQLINAVERADAGSIQVFGAPLPSERLERFRRRIGYAVQGTGLFPHMTSRENVVLLAKLEGWAERAVDDRYHELLAQMDLPASVSNRYPAQLSGGQRQRLGLCRALMLKPGLLLLDEPFSAVDPLTRAAIYERFEEVRRRDAVSALLVTHDMREAALLADHLVVMREGTVVQSGARESVFGAPTDAYVRRLAESRL